MVKIIPERLIDEIVQVVPYHVEWPEYYSKERCRLERALNDPLIAFEHIGSTAVSEMHSKPIIDIMIGIRDYPPVAELIKKLCFLGYSFHGEAGVPDRLHFTQRGKINFNLAVVLFDGIHWKRNIQLRDYLGKHPEDCREYEKVKKNALNSGADRLISYSAFKESFIRHLFAKLREKI